ncbi:hypothetical protein SPRG_13557 [Saprolegnia parasitica CBS 223.65]|uniref:Uncharacterized protein n=1 Tax=Saprolegnia parasitica (strain CBS 223.65) TaxID=695850 RepID=A0A067BSP1_SAPPC|nr:hypothetical protein SPRG_13557 [Saprolegnia parasitica CBS 223.65]KDO21258.1 hypothetical protein SPRG_13557 [Saprolegnia parasitica CBS 223.65]|eukprot:XP_012208002.1 hypothetical protein SPRG_13557 [Saprolegnia parasitica CBS 223.65]
MESPSVVAAVVTLLSTTEGRTKVYRFLQYMAKSVRISVYSKDADVTVEPRGLRWLRTIESLTASARKANRLFRFLDMYVLFPTLRDRDSTVRRLRQARVLTFFFMFLFENLSIFFPQPTAIEGVPMTLHLSRYSHTMWLLSILLGIVLDHKLARGSASTTLKHLLELPIATILALRLRVSDATMCSLGLSSSVLSLALHSHRTSVARHVTGCDRQVE